MHQFFTFYSNSFHVLTRLKLVVIFANPFKIHNCSHSLSVLLPNFDANSSKSPEAFPELEKKLYVWNGPGKLFYFVVAVSICSEIPALQKKQGHGCSLLAFVHLSICLILQHCKKGIDSIGF